MLRIDGDTGESGSGEVDGDVQELEVSDEEQQTEEDDSIESEFGEGLTREDFIKAIKKERIGRQRSEERADLYRDLYNSASKKPTVVQQPQQQQRQQRQQGDDFDGNEIADLASKRDVEDAVTRALNVSNEEARAQRRAEWITTETSKFAESRPDFYERLDFVKAAAARDPRISEAVEYSDRPWDLVYKLAVELGYQPKIQPKKQAGNLEQIKKNAQKPKPISSIGSQSVNRKRISEMTDEEFEKHIASVKDR